MPDDKTNTGGRDRDLINASENYELKYIEDKLGVSREALLQAINEVGNDRQKVEEYLKGKANR